MRLTDATLLQDLERTELEPVRRVFHAWRGTTIPYPPGPWKKPATRRAKGRPTYRDQEFFKFRILGIHEAKYASAG